MIFLLGTKSNTRVLGGLTAWCGRCESPRPHQLYRRVYRLTLFFVPTVPVRYGHFTVCLSCANTLKVTAEEAERLMPYLDR